jgi:hypothetical protein
MRSLIGVVLLLLFAILRPEIASALDKVDPYICPTKAQGSGLDCFLEAVPQTYTMCRHIKSIEIIEFGMTGAQEGVHGAKTESCIDKHKFSIARPFQAALREAARSKEELQGLHQLFAAWLESLGNLVPGPSETYQGYRERVMLPYRDFEERSHAIRALAEGTAKPAAAAAAKRKKSGP